MGISNQLSYLTKLIFLYQPLIYCFYDEGNSWHGNLRKAIYEYTNKRKSAWLRWCAPTFKRSLQFASGNNSGGGLFGTKPLSGPLQPCCQLDPKEHIPVKFCLKFKLKKMHLNISSTKWRPFCLGLNVLTCHHGLMMGRRRDETKPVLGGEGYLNYVISPLYLILRNYCRNLKMLSYREILPHRYRNSHYKQFPFLQWYSMYM